MECVLVNTVLLKSWVLAQPAAINPRSQCVDARLASIKLTLPRTAPQAGQLTASTCFGLSSLSNGGDIAGEAMMPQTYIQEWSILHSSGSYLLGIVPSRPSAPWPFRETPCAIFTCRASAGIEVQSWKTSAAHAANLVNRYMTLSLRPVCDGRAFCPSPVHAQETRAIDHRKIAFRRKKSVAQIHADTLRTGVPARTGAGVVIGIIDKDANLAQMEFLACTASLGFGISKPFHRWPQCRVVAGCLLSRANLRAR
jgi:hypothetical protein